MKKELLALCAVFCISQSAFAAASDYELALVLGPGRSGTSMLTKAVNVAGMSLTRGVEEHNAPSDKRANPLGSYEDGNIGWASRMASREAGQKALKSSEGSIRAPQRNIDDFARILTSYFEQNPKIVIKNTRAGILLPTWQAAIDKIIATGKTVDVKYIVSLRNPISVATSISRKGYSFEDGLTTWETSLKSTLDGTAGKSRFFVKFEDIQAPHTDATIQKLATFLGTVPDPAAVAAFKTDFLNPAYVHSDIPFNTVTDSRLSVSQKALVAQLETLYNAQ